MKKNILSTITLTAFFAVAIILISSIGNEGIHSAYARVTGSPGNRTGSPADGNSCTLCHTTFPLNSGNGTVSVTAPGLASGYIPGQTYTITATITDAGVFDFGFEVTAERDANNAKVGTFVLTDPTNTRFPLGTIMTAVTHTSAGSSGSGTRSWSFDWTAPSAGTGDVTFYGAFNAADGGGPQSNDRIYTATPLNVSEDTGAGIDEMENELQVKLYPNPVVSELQILADTRIKAIEVYNSRGQIVLNNSQQNKIDVETLTSGLYFVKIYSGDKTSIQKLIKK